MAVGRRKKLSGDERSRIAKAVDAAEEFTGMQFLVYLGDKGKDPRAAAEALLMQQGYTTVPGAVIVVAPSHRRVELATSAQGSERVSDEACSRVIDVMIPSFREGDWITGLESGLAAVAKEAGQGASTSEELPDILD